MDRRTAAACTGIIAIVGLLTGCAVPFGFACPAIGWSNALTVEIEGEAARVAQVQLCTADGCAPSDALDLSHPLALISLADRDADTWTFSTDMLDLDRVTVRAVAADGSVLSATPVSPDWIRVGGSAQCGGPAEATVTARI